MKYRCLPHIDIEGHYQFITFRTQDSTDNFLKKLSAQSKPNNKKQLEVDDYLDTSQHGAYLNNGVLVALNAFFIDKDKLWYELIAFCIMPNHIHLLIKPNDTLPAVMQKIKGSSAKMINDLMERSGQFWAKDYYDKAIRDEKHFDVVYQYIQNNPLKLSEAKTSPPRFFGIYETPEVGL